MFETATDKQLRDAYRAAHEARAEAITDFFSWMRGKRNS